MTIPAIAPPDNLCENDAFLGVSSVITSDNSS